jgi:protein-tyrosine phosphatase
MNQFPTDHSWPLPEIHQQFEELEWRQRLRIVEANNSPETSRWVIEQDLEVLQRNRYANVQPWKNSRIHLSVPHGQSDYINASPISVKASKTEMETKYIATQVRRAIDGSKSLLT